MPTRVLLELTNIDSSEVYFHLNAKLLKEGSLGCFRNTNWMQREGKGDSITDIGHELLSALAQLDGIEVMFSPYAFSVRLPMVFDIPEKLWKIVWYLREVVLNDDIRFATTLGDDVFVRPTFITNPTQKQFNENLSQMVDELRLRKSRARVEAEYTIERLTELIREAR